MRSAFFQACIRILLLQASVTLTIISMLPVKALKIKILFFWFSKSFFICRAEGGITGVGGILFFNKLTFSITEHIQKQVFSLCVGLQFSHAAPMLMAKGRFFFCYIVFLYTVEPPMGGHLTILQNGILYTNEPPMSSHLR